MTEQREAARDAGGPVANPWRPGYADLFDRLDRARSGPTIRPYLSRLGLIREGLSVLAIGGGAGHLEVELASRDGARVGYLDPSPILRRRFERNVAAAGVSARILERHLGPFQTFASERRWDLALSVHSWAYMGRSEAMLEKALGLLAPGGRLCIVLGSERSQLEALKGVVRPEGDGPALLEDLSRWATGRGHAHRLDRVESSLPADRWLGPDGFTEYGRAWLAYMGRHEWSSLPADRKARAEGFVRSAQVDGQLRNAWGALVFER